MNYFWTLEKFGDLLEKFGEIWWNLEKFGEIWRKFVSFFENFVKLVSNQRSFSFPLRGWSLLNVVLLVFSTLTSLISLEA